MSGINPTFQTGPRTCEAKNAVSGGMLVEHATGSSASKLPYIQPSAADSAVAMGVAAKDAVPVASQAGFDNGNTAYNGPFPTTDVSVPDELTAVYHDCFVKMKYTDAVTERAAVFPGANGNVQGTGTAGHSVGWCAEPGGVAAGGVGLTRILI